MNNRSSLVRVRLLALGAAIYLLATLWAMHAAFGQTPQVWVERPRQDTIVELTPTDRPMVFGFSRVVMGVTALPLTAPPRAYCVRATVSGPDTLLVDPPVTDAEPILPQCDRAQVPLVIRPECQLTYEEHVAWQVKRERPVVFVCSHDGTPVVLLLTKPGYP